MTRILRLSAVTVTVTYVLILLGGITRTEASGLGCESDWPLCQGKPYPPLNAMAIVEYLHRTVAASVALLVVLTALAAWLTAGVAARTKAAAGAALGLIFAQGMLGAAGAEWDLPARIGTLHLALAMLFFAAMLLTVLFAAADAGAPRWLTEILDRPGVPDRRFVLAADVGALVTFVLLLSGGLANRTDAARTCDAWPWCSGKPIVPGAASSQVWLDFSHRTIALAGTLTVGIVFWLAMRRPVSRAARRTAEIALGAVLIQSLIGGAYVVSSGSSLLSAAHLAAAALLWAAMVGVAIAARQPAEARSTAISAPELGYGGLAPAGAGLQMSAVELDRLRTPAALAGGAAAVSLAPAFALPDVRRFLALVNEYVRLTKPGILTLLLATELGGMLAGAAGLPSIWLILAALAGGTLAAGGANALNCYIDRDIDALMGRTKKRGTVTGVIPPWAALTFGLSLTVSAVLLLGFAVNWLSAGLALLGNVYYVLIYTKWLKRRTPQNIVIGGAAGAMPPVVGWAAATGHVSVAAVLMFAIIYYWTPPHFWALALLKQGEYGRAAVPMLPNVRGEEETRWQVLLYTLMLAAVGLMLAPFGMSWIYLTGTVVLNGIFIWYAVKLYRAPSKALARRTFFYSLWYLFFIFAFMVADRLILA